MNALTAIDLCAGYAGTDTIHDVSLTVAPGEVVALLGVNGAGKTTTVRAIGGLIPLRRGSVDLNGENITFVSIQGRAVRGLGIVTDEPMLSPAMTVAENLLLATKHQNHLTEVESWFPQLGLMVQHNAGTLSGGEQRLVMLARALVAGPKVLIVDELSAGLSPALAATVMSALRRAADAWGAGVVIVEQATKLALGAADRAIVLARGRVALEGPAAELASRPDVLETAYLGSF